MKTNWKRFSRRKKEEKPPNPTAVSFWKKRALGRGSAPVPTPPPTIFRHFRDWGSHGGRPLQEQCYSPGVVDGACLPPPPTIFGHFRDWGSHGGRPLQENETAGHPGLFHSQENDDFVGVVPPCLPPHQPFSVISEIGAATGGGPYKRMKPPGPPPTTCRHFRHRGSHGGQPLQEQCYSRSHNPLPSQGGMGERKKNSTPPLHLKVAVKC